MSFEKTRPTLAKVRSKMENYCAYQERCHSEVKGKLFHLGLKSDEADEILVHLIQQGFLNEERFANAYVSGKFTIKGWGRKKIIYQLKGKGINVKLIQAAISRIEETDYEKTLYSLIEKKAATMKEKDSFKKMASLTQYLVNTGYEIDLVINFVKKYFKP